MAQAELVDEIIDEGQHDELEITSEFDKPEQEPKQEEDIPEKYRGKSLKEIAQMHQEAEKILGKQGSELGEYRKMFDTYVKEQLSQKQAPKQEDEVDFFAEPEKAVSRAIENHPKIQEAEKVTAEYRKQSAQASLKQKHPDMLDIVGDSKFLEWVQASKIRTSLLIQADQQYDVDAADELFSLWKERQQIVQKTAEVEKADRRQTAKSANTGNVRGSGETSRKIYRRDDIRNLMRDDPARYEQLAPEILQAYAEGRVR